MGREVRMVPATWEHPKDADGDYIALSDGFAERVANWHCNWAAWNIGYREDWNGGWKPLEDDEREMSYEEWDGDCPDPADYMPDWPAALRTHYQMYEDTSEGTPLSPPMETPEELARYLADNNASAFGSMTATYDQWLATINQGFAVSGVWDGHRMMSGVEANTELKD